MDTSGFDGAFDFDGKQPKKAQRKGIVDIIFLIDISASMGPAIAQIGKNIVSFVEGIDTSIVKDWRVKFYSFGDLDTDSAEIKLNVTRPFISHDEDHQKVVDQLLECFELVKKGGGGDEPESSLDAMYLAVKDGFDAPWNERTRAVVLFSDATPKPIKKETLGIDTDAIALLSQQINDNHTYCFMFAPIHDDYKAISINCPKYTKYNAINDDGSEPVEALRNTDFSEILKILGKSVSQASLVS